jgi:hypothetical protein
VGPETGKGLDRRRTEPGSSMKWIPQVKHKGIYHTVITKSGARLDGMKQASPAVSC